MLTTRDRDALRRRVDPGDGRGSQLFEQLSRAVACPTAVVEDAQCVVSDVCQARCRPLNPCAGEILLRFARQRETAVQRLVVIGRVHIERRLLHHRRLIVSRLRKKQLRIVW